MPLYLKFMPSREVENRPDNDIYVRNSLKIQCCSSDITGVQQRRFPSELCTDKGVTLAKWFFAIAIFFLTVT
jgi:hypothetical protein